MYLENIDSVEATGVYRTFHYLSQVLTAIYMILAAIIRVKWCACGLKRRCVI